MGVTGCFNAAWKLKLMLSASAKWIELCGADDPLDHIAIYYGDDDDSNGMSQPRAIIHDASEGGNIVFNRQSLGAWRREGTLMSIFEIEIPSAIGEVKEDRGNWMQTQMGQIVADLMAMTNPPAATVQGEMPLNFASIVSSAGPGEVPLEELHNEFGEIVLPLWFQMLEYTLVP